MSGFDSPHVVHVQLSGSDDIDRYFIFEAIAREVLLRIQTSWHDEFCSLYPRKIKYDDDEPDPFTCEVNGSMVTITFCSGHFDLDNPFSDSNSCQLLRIQDREVAKSEFVRCLTEFCGNYPEYHLSIDESGFRLSWGILPFEERILREMVNSMLELKTYAVILQPDEDSHYQTQLYLNKRDDYGFKVLYSTFITRSVKCVDEERLDLITVLSFPRISDEVRDKYIQESDEVKSDLGASMCILLNLTDDGNCE